jgi:hypothetical protein
MSLHTDEQFLTAVAAALGETVSLIRRRGFHLERVSSDSDWRPAGARCRRHANRPDDTFDLAAYGVDWDANDDSRLHRRPRRLTARRRRSAA